MYPPVKNSILNGLSFWWLKEQNPEWIIILYIFVTPSFSFSTKALFFYEEDSYIGDTQQVVSLNMNIYISTHTLNLLIPKVKVFRNFPKLTTHTDTSPGSRSFGHLPFEGSFNIFFHPVLFSFPC